MVTAAPQGILATWLQTPRATKALLVGILVNRLAGFIQLFLVLFLTHRGFTPAQAGLALSLYGAGAVLGTFVGGAASDRLSPRSATLLSMVGSAVLILSILYVSIYPLLLAAVLLVSAIGQLYRPAAQTLITELTPRAQLVMVTAMYRLAMNLGATAAPLLGAALVSVSYNLLFWGEALAALTYGAIATLALPAGRPSSAAAAATGGPAPAGSRGRYLELLADWRYTVFVTGIFLMSVVYCQYTATLPLAITGAGLSLWWYGAVVSLNGFIVITCELVLTRFVQTWPLRLIVLASLSLLAIGYGVYAIAIVPMILVLGTLIWTMAEIVGAPTVFAYPGMVAPERLRGRYIGAMQSLYGLGAAVGPIVGIALFTHAGRLVWLAGALVALLAALLAEIGIQVPASRLEAAPEPAS